MTYNQLTKITAFLSSHRYVMNYSCAISRLYVTSEKQLSYVRYKLQKFTHKFI